MLFLLSTELLHIMWRLYYSYYDVFVRELCFILCYYGKGLSLSIMIKTLYAFNNILLDLTLLFILFTAFLFSILNLLMLAMCYVRLMPQEL